MIDVVTMNMTGNTWANCDNFFQFLFQRGSVHNKTETNVTCCNSASLVTKTIGASSEQMLTNQRVRMDGNDQSEAREVSGLCHEDKTFRASSINNWLS